MKSGQLFSVPDNYIGVFEPQSGYLRSELAIKTLIKAVTEAGCVFYSIAQSLRLLMVVWMSPTMTVPTVLKK